MSSLPTPPRRRTPRRRLALLVAALAATAVPTVVGTQAAQAAPVAGYAFLWANQQFASSYTPHLSYQVNSTGAAVQNTIVRNSTGNYTVTLPGLGGNVGHVQVVAQGTNLAQSQRCKVGGWGGTTDMRITVFCHSGNTAVDSQFSLLYQNNIGNKSYHSGYMWSSGPTSSYSYNSRGGVNSLINNSVGSYTATFPGLDLGRGNVQVTAYGGNSNYCKVTSWGGSSAYILCFDYAGNRVNSQFNVAFTANRSYTGPSATQGAYGWAGSPTNMNWYDLTGTYGWTSSGGLLRARKVGAGRYEVEVGSMPVVSDSLPLVTAYGSGDSTRCRIGTWSVWGLGALATVYCQSASGAFTDSAFSFAHVTSYP